MCGDGGASARASAAAQAEAERQAAAERTRLADEASAAKAETERRAADEAARFQQQLDQQKADAAALRDQIAGQETARLTAQQKVEEERKAEREADLLRQSQEQKAAEAAAAKKASDLSAYNTGRQTLVDDARGKVNSAFAPYDDSYYTGYANDYVSYYKPQLAQAFDDAKRKATYNYANRGSLASSTAARAFGRLDQERTQEEADIAQRAQSAANTLRQGVDTQRSKLLDGIFGALGSAPVITADNVGDANSALAQIGSALNTPVSLAGTMASTISPPAFGSLDPNVFTIPGAGAPVPRASVGAGGVNTYGAVNRSGGSGRLVN